MDGIHTHCSVLLALTSSGKAGSTAEGYDKLLWQKIMKGNMLQTTDYFTSTSSAGEFDQVFQQLILALLLKVDGSKLAGALDHLQSQLDQFYLLTSITMTAGCCTCAAEQVQRAKAALVVCPCC